jgi:hypothetical protein
MYQQTESDTENYQPNGIQTQVFHLSTTCEEQVFR